MNKNNLKRLVYACVFIFSIVMFSSCSIEKGILQVSPEVDFSVPQNVQILFNNHIYDTVITFKNSKLEVNFANENDLMNSAYVSLDSEKYRITYNSMVFDGETVSLSESFLPSIIFSFLSSFESDIEFNSFNEQKSCYYTKQNLNNYFVVFECYKMDDKISYSMEIK